MSLPMRRAPASRTMREMGRPAPQPSSRMKGAVVVADDRISAVKRVRGEDCEIAHEV